MRLDVDYIWDCKISLRNKVYYLDSMGFTRQERRKILSNQIGSIPYITPFENDKL